VAVTILLKTCGHESLSEQIQASPGATPRR